MSAGMWQTWADDGLVDPRRSQKALAASITRLVGGDTRIAASVVLAVAHHIHVEASERLLSHPWQGWAEALHFVGEHMPPASGTDL